MKTILAWTVYIIALEITAKVFGDHMWACGLFVALVVNKLMPSGSARGSSSPAHQSLPKSQA